MALIKKYNGKPEVIANKSVIDHNQLANRDQYGAHSISAIRKLPEKLTQLKNKDIELDKNIETINETLKEHESNIKNNSDNISELNNKLDLDIEASKGISLKEVEDEQGSPTGKLNFTDYKGNEIEVQGGFLADEDTIQIKDNKIALKKVYTDSTTLIGNGSDEENKLSAKAIKDENGLVTVSRINNIQREIDAIEGTGGYLNPYDFETATPDEPKDDLSAEPKILSLLTQEALKQITSVDKPEEIWNGTRITNLYNNHTWILNNNYPQDFSWIDLGQSLVSIATTETAGIVKSSNEKYKVKVEEDGVMSLNGVDSVVDLNSEQIIEGKKTFKNIHIDNKINNKISVDEIVEAVTIEEISLNNYSISTDLTECGLSNQSNSIKELDSYKTYIIASSEHYIDPKSVKIIMGDIDITSNTYDEKNNLIYIEEVNGDISITAVATSALPKPDDLLNTKWIFKEELIAPEINSNFNVSIEEESSGYVGVAYIQNNYSYLEIMEVASWKALARYSYPNNIWLLGEGVSLPLTILFTRSYTSSLFIDWLFENAVRVK